MIRIDTTTQRAVKRSTSLPANVHDYVAALAKSEHRSFSNMLVVMIESYREGKNTCKSCEPPNA